MRTPLGVTWRLTQKGFMSEFCMCDFHKKANKQKQEGHDGPESLTRNNCFSVLEIIHCQYFLIFNLSESN
jgi:hypothetical protein